MSGLTDLNVNIVALTAAANAVTAAVANVPTTPGDSDAAVAAAAQLLPPITAQVQAAATTLASLFPAPGV